MPSACRLHVLVRSRRLELPRPFGHSDLNAARLPVPPRPHVMKIGRRSAIATGRARPLAKRPQARNAVPRTRFLPHIGTHLKTFFTMGQGARYVHCHAHSRSRRDCRSAPHGGPRRERERFSSSHRDGAGHFRSSAELRRRPERRERAPSAPDDHPYSRCARTAGKAVRIRVTS